MILDIVSIQLHTIISIKSEYALVPPYRELLCPDKKKYCANCNRIIQTIKYSETELIGMQVLWNFIDLKIYIYIKLHALRDWNTPSNLIVRSMENSMHQLSIRRIFLQL